MPADTIFWIVVPTALVWLYVLVDVVRRPGLRAPVRVLWLVAVTVWLPAASLWLLARPVGDPAAAAARRVDPGDPQVRLARLVAAHDDGDLDDDAFARERDLLLG
ncbi:hypothetical protein OEB99_05585 [Actinotalea sp. M2MS4P-6]|uniref:hypothetical protein n=1 Tax=Actinotalea sp. M2MS4P-6 TaxID=2983762 RepID=UPI0021E427EC|nr:hypothetical protein [Actinotalea sp. M2MS4P-6]MCV2393774.1 hypothetical protein [Actinotalea sp. M2MS4P-6]